MNSETEEIMMIKDHLKEVAEYYSQSFFEKTNMEGMGMEGIEFFNFKISYVKWLSIFNIMNSVSLLLWTW